MCADGCACSHVSVCFFPVARSAHRNLTAWAESGVLMLNTCLTVRAHSAGSHQGKGWEQFTDRVIQVVDRYGGANLGAKSGFGRGVVFLAWGAWAAKRVAKLNKVGGLVGTFGRLVPTPKKKNERGREASACWCMCVCGKTP
jgi:uracil-DNA glycosylase